RRSPFGESQGRCGGQIKLCFRLPNRGCVLKFGRWTVHGRIAGPLPLIALSVSPPRGGGCTGWSCSEHSRRLRQDQLLRAGGYAPTPAEHRGTRKWPLSPP